MRQKTLTFIDTTSGSYAFPWTVAIEGYKWLGDEYMTLSSGAPELAGDSDPCDRRAPWLVGQGKYERIYAPLSKSKTDLHRRFAKLYTQESILGFANKYGLLGTGIERLYSRALVYSGGSPEEGQGESLDRWRTESSDLGSLLYIWDMVRRKDAGKLGQLFIWHNTGDGVNLCKKREYNDEAREWRVYPWSPATDSPTYGCSTQWLAARPAIAPHLLDRWKRGDVVEPARYYVIDEVNKHLKGHVSPKILPYFENRVFLFPDSLLSALWIMFLMEVTDNIRLRQCQNCSEWKEEKIGRRTAFYCSPACRQKAYYKRKKQEAKR